jgi:hypothetical protein
MMLRGISKKQFASLKGTFIPLLVALLIVLVIAPVAGDWPLASSLLVACVLITGVFAIHDIPMLRRTMVAIVVAILALRWLAHLYGEEHGALVAMSHLTFCMYMILLGAICIAAVLRREQVTGDTVLGAVCGYMLIAYIFAFGYAVLEDVKPGSFSSSVVLPEYDGAKIGHGTTELLYYSFVILTSVGFGDIVPANGAARSLSILEMLAGQLYLAGFVARLVGVMGSGGIGPSEEASGSDGP